MCPDLGLGKINVEFSDDSSISSSTCRKKTTYRTKCPDNPTFLAAIHALCDNAGEGIYKHIRFKQTIFLTCKRV